MNDVAIIGVGLHPFGRFDKTAMEMGAEAIQLALADAGVEWKDIQFGVRRQPRGVQPRCGDPAGRADRHHVHQRVQRLRHRGQRHSADRRHHPAWASTTSASPSAWTSTPAARSPTTPPSWRCRSGTRENGQFVTTKFFGMKANRYLHDHGISQETLAKVAAKNFRNGVLEPECVPPQADFRGRDPRLAGAELPADAVHVLRARRGRRGGGHVPRRHRAPVHRQAGVRAGSRDPHPPLRRLRGARHVAPVDEDVSPTVYAAQGRLRGGRHRARGRRRRPAAGHRRRRRGHPHGRDGSVRRRRAGEAAGRRRHRDPRLACRSTPTAG